MPKLLSSAFSHLLPAVVLTLAGAPLTRVTPTLSHGERERRFPRETCVLVCERRRSSVIR
jgi:hypothetical protein